MNWGRKDIRITRRSYHILVILDSSMLILPLEKKLNLTAEIERILPLEHELVVPKKVIEELEKLKKEGTLAIQRKSKLALELAEAFKIIDSKFRGKTDDVIFELAIKHKAVVATNDRELRKRLRSEGIAVISLRGNNKLSLFGYVERDK
ncbi:MAG: type II toxin-antitoxin system VapC family toxin [Candidatus Heimdallarchaeaceae archaeon]